MQWTIKETAEFLQVPEERIYEWIRHRGLPTTQFNGRYHFNRLKLLDWAQENQLPILVQNGTDLPTLKDALRDGGFYPGLSAPDKSTLFDHILRSMPLPKGVDLELIHQLILSREQEGSTAVGRGIAIPHARHPILLRTGKPLVAFCALKDPLDFGAPDGQKVSALFLIISPSIRLHLHLLERLGHALRDKEFSRLVQEGGTFPKILARLEEIEGSIPVGEVQDR